MDNKTPNSFEACPKYGALYKFPTPRESDSWRSQLRVFGKPHTNFGVLLSIHALGALCVQIFFSDLDALWLAMCVCEGEREEVQAKKLHTNWSLVAASLMAV